MLKSESVSPVAALRGRAGRDMQDFWEAGKCLVLFFFFFPLSYFSVAMLKTPRSRQIIEEKLFSLMFPES